jgi:hypothetical protein
MDFWFIGRMHGKDYLYPNQYIIYFQQDPIDAVQRYSVFHTDVKRTCLLELSLLNEAIPNVVQF